MNEEIRVEGERKERRKERRNRGKVRGGKYCQKESREI